MEVYIWVVGVISLLMLMLGALLQLHRPTGLYLKAGLFLIIEAVLIGILVFSSSLWEPSMGLPAQVFLAVFALGGLATAMVVLFLWWSDMVPSVTAGFAAGQVVAAPLIFLLMPRMIPEKYKLRLWRIVGKAERQPIAVLKPVMHGLPCCKNCKGPTRRQ